MGAISVPVFFKTGILESSFLESSSHNITMVLVKPVLKGRFEFSFACFTKTGWAWHVTVYFDVKQPLWIHWILVNLNGFGGHWKKQLKIGRKIKNLRANFYRCVLPVQLPRGWMHYKLGLLGIQHFPSTYLEVHCTWIYLENGLGYKVNPSRSKYLQGSILGMLNFK